MIKQIAKYARHYVVLFLSLIRDTLYDSVRMLRHSHGALPPSSKEQSQFRIRKAYHGIEKGMSLPEPRYQFGLSRIADLTLMLNQHIAEYGLDSTAIAASSAIKAYDVANDTNFAARLYAFHQTQSSKDGGIDKVKFQIFSDHSAFLKSRRSVRQFSDEKVPVEQIAAAVEIAQNAPSVCNRQAARVHAFEDPEVLKLQPGNSGFGDKSAWALVVTCDLRGFSTSGERHQAWCDGGMFAMSLLYGLHSLRLGACPLAWTTNASTDRKVRRKLNIPNNEVIIMFIAVGALREQYAVAKSFRKDPLDAMIIRTEADYSL